MRQDQGQNLIKEGCTTSCVPLARGHVFTSDDTDIRTDDIWTDSVSLEPKQTKSELVT